MMTVCPQKRRKWTRPPTLIHKIGRILEWGLFGLVFLALVAGLFYWQVLASEDTFRKETGVGLEELLTLYRESQGLALPATEEKINFLLLGTDTLAYRDPAYPLTDTIIIASLDLAANQATVLSIPRDLYLPMTGGKINAVYQSYFVKDPASASEQTRAYLSELWQIPLSYVVVVSLQDVQDFLTLIEGITVEVAADFTDYQYPRDDVDIRQVTDPALLYETVSFTAGETWLEPEQALKYLRSRHAAGVQGSDYARSRRQQQVLVAAGAKVGQTLLRELKKYDFTFLAKLYNFYQQRFEQQIPFTHLLALTRYFLGRNQLPEVTLAELAIAPAPGAVLHESTQGKEWSLQVTNFPALVKEVQEKLGSAY